MAPHTGTNLLSRIGSTVSFAICLLVYNFGVMSQVHAEKCAAQDAIPDYVIKHAPLIWLHSEDPYMPSSISGQLEHTTPQVNYTVVEGSPSPLTLDNVNSLDEHGGTDVYLTSNEGIRALPSWFEGVRPNAETGETEGATTSAVVVRDHGDGVVDAFYFYFYAYNQGNTVIGIQFGNHVGDWEHNMIRFKNGEPQSIWYSQHAGGEAFTYACTEKQGVRPIGYSGNGTHATYATPGTHDHTIPNFNLPAGFLEDKADRGVLWDPVINAYTFSYSTSSKAFEAYDADTPVNWLQFSGQWGDEQLPDDAEGQINIFGQRKYSSGPNGPKFKGLDRENVCPDDVDPCIVRPFLTARREV